MTGVLCTWAANFAGKSLEWYEEEYIPEMTAKLAKHVLHCELVESGLDAAVGGVGTQEAPWEWLTLYEMENSEKATDSTYDESNHATMSGDLANARFDVRTYEEHARWQTSDWQGDPADIASVAVMEWQIAEGKEKEVLDFYKNLAAPSLAKSPDILRFRIFEIKNATVLKAGSYDTLEKKNLHTYLTVSELATEQWPWDVVFALAEMPQWQEYFEEQRAVKWQSSHYVVKRIYPDPDENASNAEQ